MRSWRCPLGAAGLEDELERLLSEAPHLVPGFAAYLTERPAPEGAEKLQREAVDTVFCHLARGLSRERPLVHPQARIPHPDAGRLGLALAALQDLPLAELIGLRLPLRHDEERKNMHGDGAQNRNPERLRVGVLELLLRCHQYLVLFQLETALRTLEVETG